MLKQPRSLTIRIATQPTTLLACATLAFASSACGLVAVNGKSIGLASGGATENAGRSAPDTGYGVADVANPVASLTTASSSRTSGDIPAPKRGIPIKNWSPVQQFQAFPSAFQGPLGVAYFLDALGSKASELGRLRAIRDCFARGSRVDPITVTLCGDLLASADLQKAAAEFRKEGVNGDTDIKQLGESLDSLKASAAEVAHAMAADRGYKQFAGQAAKGKGVWDAFVAANPAAPATLDKLDAALGTARTGDEACLKQTLPAFAAVVKAASYSDGYPGKDLDIVRKIAKPLSSSPASYLAYRLYALCAYNADASAAGLYDAAINPSGSPKSETGFAVYRGPRTSMLLSLLDESFNPRLGDGQDMSWVRQASEIGSMTLDDTVKGAAIRTPSDGVVGSITEIDGGVKISFNSYTADYCVNWQDSKKISSILPNGDIMYERYCAKSAPTKFNGGDFTASSLFARGIVKGNYVVEMNGMPVAVFANVKASKPLIVFGVARE